MNDVSRPEAAHAEFSLDDTGLGGGRSATAELLDRLSAFLRRYVVLPGERELTAVVLFTLHSWAINAAHATPYLLVISPEKRSGKTRLLEVLRLLVRAPWATTSTSEAALFRRIERDKPTLLLDEIDAIFGSYAERTEPLRAVLNSGNRRGVTVTRCVGKHHEVHEFPVFCPKVLAGIDRDRRLPETIRDRAITLRMRRRHDGEPVERFRERKADQLANPIRDSACAWAGGVLDELLRAEPDVPEGLSDRSADAWEPLLAIADLAGDEWPARARDAALGLSDADEPDQASMGALLLAKMRTLLAGRDVIATEDALTEINGDDELPFGGWHDGKGLDSRTLAVMLRKYDARPRPVRIGDKTPRGYRADDMRDAWARYLPRETQQEQQAQHAAPGSAPTGAHDTGRRRESPDKYADVADVALVADVSANGGASGSRLPAIDPPSDTTRPPATLADLSDGALLLAFPGSTILGSDDDTTGRRPHDPLCPYPAHAGSSWRAHSGRLVCSVCHPPAAECRP